MELNRRLGNLNQLWSAESAALTEPSISGKTTLQAAAALVLQVGNPEFLAREIIHLLHATECVRYASVISTSKIEEVVETIGNPTGNACKRLSIGCAHGRNFDVLAEINIDGESVAAVGAINILLSGIRALEQARIEREERLKLWPLDDSPLEDDGAVITGQMRNLMLLARKVARTSVSVLLTGESGTGKEILARAIHSHSARADKPFIPFNCTAVPREMLESQLFGHRRGAFTSADRDNPGLIRAAKGGTLFLDEIGELGLDLQPKLLRFLESGEICPLGEPSPLTVDVRVIAATNRNLEQLVQEGHFREDLFYRLHVIPLAIPPLRERRDEIPSLVHHFVARAATEFSKGRLQVAEETMEHFLLHPWPGNVRQLQNEVRRMVALAECDSVLTPASLSPEMRRAAPRPSSRNNGSLELTVPLTDKLMPTLSRIEREMISAALRANQGRLDAAAKALGISRKGLYLKRQRLGL
jgi:DNA-binding NtrC family response regulator